MFSKVLVAIDSSAASRRAFASALEIAKGLNAELLQQLHHAPCPLFGDGDSSSRQGRATRFG